MNIGLRPPNSSMKSNSSACPPCVNVLAVRPFAMRIAQCSRTAFPVLALDVGHAAGISQEREQRIGRVELLARGVLVDARLVGPAPLRKLASVGWHREMGGCVPMNTVPDRASTSKFDVCANSLPMKSRCALPWSSEMVRTILGCTVAQTAGASVGDRIAWRRKRGLAAG